jgi:uncharacterized protein YndB with AHSA1/START domain
MVEQTNALTVTFPSDREMVMTRTFGAPARLVFDAWTKCEHLPHWFGPRDWSLPECEVDLRPGGAYRFLMLKDDGTEMVMTGGYKEISPPKRLVSTEVYDDWPDQEVHNTLVLEERDGKTTITVTSVFPSDEMRKAWSGAEEGARESFDRLEEHLRVMS